MLPLAAGFLGILNERRPQLEIETVAAATQQPMRRRYEGEVDIVMAPGHLADPGIIRVPLFNDELVLVVPPGHHLADREFVEATDLEDETYFTYSRTAHPGFEYERFIRPAAVIPRLLRTVEITDAIVQLVAAGFGVSILARWAIRPALESGRVVAVQVGPDGLQLGWSALLRESNRRGSPARAVANLLSEWCGVEGPWLSDSAS